MSTVHQSPFQALVHSTECKKHLWTADSQYTKLTFTAHWRPAVTVNVFIHKTCQPVNKTRLLLFGQAWPWYDLPRAPQGPYVTENCVQSSTEGTLKNILHLQAGSRSGMLVVELNVVFTGPTGDYKAIRHGYCSMFCGWNCKGDGSLHSSHMIPCYITFFFIIM